MRIRVTFINTLNESFARKPQRRCESFLWSIDALTHMHQNKEYAKTREQCYGQSIPQTTDRNNFGVVVSPAHLETKLKTTPTCESNRSRSSWPISKKYSFITISFDVLLSQNVVFFRNPM